MFPSFTRQSARFARHYSSLIKETTQLTDFKTLVKTPKLTIADFYAEWCGPCKAISPVISKLSEEHKDVVNFVKVDVDQAQDIAQEYGISAMPTFVLFKDGEPLGKIVGANPRALQQAIDQYK